MHSALPRRRPAGLRLGLGYGRRLGRGLGLLDRVVVQERAEALVRAHAGRVVDADDGVGRLELDAVAGTRLEAALVPAAMGGGGDGGQTITGANLSSLNQNLGAAKAKRIAAEQRWRTIENTPAAEL